MGTYWREDLQWREVRRGVHVHQSSIFADLTKATAASGQKRSSGSWIGVGSMPSLTARVRVTRPGVRLALLTGPSLPTAPPPRTATMPRMPSFSSRYRYPKRKRSDAARQEPMCHTLCKYQTMG